MGNGMENVGASLSASRRGFLFGTILVFIMNFAVIALAGARGIPEWTEYLALVGILAQVILIHQREQALYASRRWRFWYALIIAGFACDLMTRHLWMRGQDIVDPIQVRGQLLVGGFLLFYIMVFPVVLRLIIRNQKS
ncbi:MAG: hypothetical protein Nkreftii_000254 [Candidatus Nitrospira kreftii]|uniref:Uncharacterized protein n=1 Tax=Candidatus Nitrospira kreftii TaxID=2652173 RepID=A0A7S8FAT0_9BACT|nr:MAG: hypothetical protein Nkreftii_000254 [Candidatus Nitrospira kreftii]